VATRYERYGDLKKDLAEIVIAGLSPIRARYIELRQQPEELEAIARMGAERACAEAGERFRLAASAMGLV
jgi:tryptophanyl-tRNA synthetase